MWVGASIGDGETLAVPQAVNRAEAVHREFLGAATALPLNVGGVLVAAGRGATSCMSRTLPTDIAA